VTQKETAKSDLYVGCFQSAEESKKMRATGKEVWGAAVKMGWASGPYDPRSGLSARADKMASLLNEVLSKRQD
jgi:hypothetical protein